jgi:GT2 family glycosyltransferase
VTEVEVSVVVVTYRSAGLIRDLLLSVPGACAGRAFEIIIVDNASHDALEAEVAAAGVPATVLHMPSNLGFARGISVGAGAARGRYVCCLNPDIRLSTGAIADLVAAAERRPGHLLYSGRVLSPEDEPDPGSVQPLPSLREYVTFGLGLSVLLRGHPRWDPTALDQWSGPEEQVVPVVAGAFVLARRAEFLAVGGFDDRYWLYSEDVDLCYRAHLRGTPPLLVPSARAVHLGGASSTHLGQRLLIYRGKATFIRLHWSRPRQRIALTALLSGVGLRAVVPQAWSRQPGWRYLWRRRRDWLPGWPAVDPTDPALPRVSRQDAGRGRPARTS